MLALVGDGPGWGWGWGFENLSRVFLGLLNAFIWLLMLAVLAGTLFLLIRFLLVGTRAAQLYIEKNAPRHPDAAAPGPTSPSPSSPSQSPTAAVPDPAAPTAASTATVTATDDADVTRPMPAAESTGATRVDPDAASTEPTKPARKTNPKSPPAP